MKRTLLTLMAAGATALGGFLVMQPKLNERAKQRRIKETFWSKLRELWAIRRRCQQIKLQQQKDRPLGSNESSTSFFRRDSRQVN
jgi:hypothetical protein